MKLKNKYIFFLVFLHCQILFLSYFIFDSNKLLFIISEAFVLISLTLSWHLYRQLITPLEALRTGLAAIKDKDFSIKFLLTGNREADGLIEVYNQMIGQLRLERKLQQEQHFFLEKIINASPIGIIVLDFDENVHLINPKVREMFQDIGFEKMSLKEFNHDIFKSIRVLKVNETKIVKFNGSETYKLYKSQFIDRGFFRIYITVEELTSEIVVTEKKVYERVIRMIVHEVNNTIGPINSIIQQTLNTEAIANYPDMILFKRALTVAYERNQNLNIFIRSFADLVKLSPPNLRHFDLRQFLLSVISFMAIEARERNIRLALDQDGQDLCIYADAQQMEQVLINVLKNAIEAIDTNGHVFLLINKAERKLSITNDGKVISPEESQYIFTPFYSTKKGGQGIGLVLVREILTNHGFDFSLKTVTDHRTEFCIIFN